MKKIVVLLLFLIVITCSLVADEGDINFTLLLNKNGTDDIWFSDNGTDTTRGKSINPVIFPLISNGAKSISRVIYFYWIKQSSNNIVIKLSFVADPTDKEYEDSTKDLTGNGYMMRRTGNMIGRNLDVTVEGNNGNTIGSVESSNTIFSAMPIGNTGDSSDNDRSITFNPESYSSPAKLTLTVEAEKGQWEIESQYEGYIRAEILIVS